MNKLKTPEEVKQYVIDTINSGNKDRIVMVLKRYWNYLKENGRNFKKNDGENLYETVKQIFT